MFQNGSQHSLDLRTVTALHAPTSMVWQESIIYPFLAGMPYSPLQTANAYPFDFPGGEANDYEDISEYQSLYSLQVSG